MTTILNYIKDNENILEKILINLKQDGICILTDYFNYESIVKFNDEFDNIFINQKKKIEILAKEKCSNDERIFHAEKYSNYIRDNFANNNLFNSLFEKYHKGIKATKKTLINKLLYEEKKIKNSGAGWHRDNHHCQFKVIMYLTDVSEKNGNFQWLTNSSAKHIGKPKPRTKNYDTRFEDKIIEDLIKNNDKCNLINIIGKKGTIIIADTTYIHRGNIIQEGERKAITQYFYLILYIIEPNLLFLSIHLWAPPVLNISLT